MSSLQVQLLEQQQSILFTFERSAVFKYLRIHIKNFVVKSILQSTWGLLSQTNSIMMNSCEELLENRQGSMTDNWVKMFFKLG